MKFSYTAIGPNKERLTGEGDAPDKFALARDLKQEGKLLISAVEANKKGFSFSKLNISFGGGVGVPEKIILARNLKAMVSAGLPLFRAVSILERQTKNKKLQNALKQVGEAISGGEPLSAGFAKFPDIFPAIFVSMVRAGEESGNLPNSLGTVADQMDKAHSLETRVKGALLYPSIIVSAMIIVGILMLIFVVPTLTNTFKELNVELPTSTQFIIGVSDFLVNYTFLFIALVILFISGILLFIRTDIGRNLWERMLLKIPLIGELIRKTNSARTARTLSSLLSSGVDVVEAIRITRDVVQNSLYKEILLTTEKGVEKGGTLSSTFLSAGNLYPLLMSEMISVGEETGKLSDMFLEVANFYEAEVENTTKNMATVIEPFLMVIVGVVVGFFAISMISPTYSLLNSI